ncbi:MAG: RDD family protein [Acidobacteria bacterium]|jgi:uncharacterized RDD family membrane protein YckC|nr:MAG: RDD family protein [Acidobacteriota bacterium]GIU82990.1 MAG: transporter [Pyrinomonadaceae bacterium]
MLLQTIKTEETLIIETPERVELEFALASIGNRFIAVLLDHTIQALLMILAWLIIIALGESDIKFFEDLSSGNFSNWILAIGLLILFAFFSGYFAFFEWYWSGQTPGKRLMKLRVIREDGRPISFWEALVRNILRIADTFPGFIVPIYSVGLISIFLSSRDQRIGDIFAGTVVIRERSDQIMTFEELVSKPLDDPALIRYKNKVEFQADLSVLTKEEVAIVENFLRRRLDLEEKRRDWMAWRLALPLMRKLKPVYDASNFTYEGFLEELLHRYKQRNPE